MEQWLSVDVKDNGDQNLLMSCQPYKGAPIRLIRQN